jgi:DHA1 family inner membrane transport protein
LVLFPFPPLLALFSFVTFVIGLGAFVVVGLLSRIAADFHVGVATAGLLMTVYGLTYAVTSPLLVSAVGSVNRSIVVAAGLAAFVVGSLGAVFAPSFPALLVARAVMAMGAGLTAPLLAAVGAALVPPEQRGRALSINFAGFTIAQVAGVPAGSWLGYAFGWRSSLAIVAALSVFALWLFVAFMPRHIPKTSAPTSSLAEIISAPGLLLPILFAIPFVSGVYVLYAFLAPFLEARYSLGRDGIAIALALYGAAAVLGNGAGGWTSDRLGPGRTLALLCIAQCILMPCLTLLPSPLAVAFVLLLIWSVSSWAFFATQQARLARRDPEKALPLFALNSSAVYLGGAIGPAIGAATLKTGGIGALGPVGALLALAALAVLYLAEII